MRKTLFRTLVFSTIALGMIPLLVLNCVENFSQPTCDENLTSAYTGTSGLRYHIAVLTFADNYIGDNLVRESIANKAAYTDAWHFDLKVPTQKELEEFEFVKNRQPDHMKRSKFAYVRKILPSYDAVFWIDIDATIMRQDVNLNQILQDMLDRNKTVAMTQTRHLTNMLNSGVIMFRNHALTYEFLDEFMKAHSFIMKCRRMRACYNKLYDQNIISYLINRWPSCNLELAGRLIHHRAPVHPNWRKFSNMVQEWPICTFNSLPAEATNATFIQHCYGGGLNLKSMTLDSKKACMSRALQGATT